MASSDGPGRQVIAVTGASRGIGSAIAAELAARGHLVGCLSRKGIGPEDRDYGPEITDHFVNIACDLLDEASIRPALAALAAQGGAIDGLVNNAGLHLEGPSDGFPTADFARVLSTNVTGVFMMCREAYPHLTAAGGGLIVNMGSFFDKLGVKYTAAYCASKAAVGAMTRCLAVEWAKDRIRLVDVAPGFVATDLNKEHMERESFRKFLERAIPTGAPGEPAEIARLVGTLFDTDLPFLTGETIYIDGGQSVTQ